MRRGREKINVETPQSRIRSIVTNIRKLVNYFNQRIQIREESSKKEKKSDAMGEISLPRCKLQKKKSLGSNAKACVGYLACEYASSASF